MSLRLLLLLSLVSVDVSGHNLGTFNDMIKKVLDKRRADFTFYGCQCGIFRGAEIVDEIDRCCHTRTCCLIRILNEGCDSVSSSYYYTYENGNITCSEDMPGCVKRLFECDKAAVLCMKSQKYIEENRKHMVNNRCKGGHLPC
ncbi:phospholipase A2, membrane associated-like [Leptodactylus fuscus]|uniref:phospholipase A2, membrane associated-like n=1 Tax=Leptodactylus fuscus TaxID=238119 RepID=UPI003F4E8194